MYGKVGKATKRDIITNMMNPEAKFVPAESTSRLINDAARAACNSASIEIRGLCSDIQNAISENRWPDVRVAFEKMETQMNHGINMMEFMSQQLGTPLYSEEEINKVKAAREKMRVSSEECYDEEVLKASLSKV